MMGESPRSRPIFISDFPRGLTCGATGSKQHSTRSDRCGRYQMMPMLDTNEGCDSKDVGHNRASSPE
jgi:hypothetical protein